MVDRYRLLQLIGEGGFGAVYMAEQREPVRRKVAVKVIKLGMDTKQVVARFEAERQALAMMDHPNIARVLDGGATASGRPYFVMELVRGVPITEFCDRESLSTRDRLSLFVDVCRAVQHAHQKGVIHRDIKPNNVLVTMHDGRPVPKVIDFGVAKATNAELTELTLFTEFRQFIGTPEYMSPEQAEMSGLDIDTRADVYSLGVLLYELLTGTHPFDPKRMREGGIQAIQRIICEEEPPRPSTRLSSLLTETGAASVNTAANGKSSVQDIARRRHTEPGQLMKDLRGDLDWIVMKCIEKDRTRRYVTANDLAADLQRHLSDQPVLAGPPSATYRLRKLVRRYRTACTVGVLIALTVVASFALVVQQWRRAEHQRQSAHAGWVEADVQRQRAEAARDESERVSLFLANMLRESDPEESGRDVTVAEVLADAARSIPSEFSDSPEIEARLRYTIGATYMALGKYDAAERQLRAAYDIRREVLGPLSDPTLISTSALAQLYAAQGRVGESEQLQRQALDTAREMYGARHERTIGLMNNLASLLRDLDRLQEAEEMISDALDAARILPEDHSYRLKALGTRALILMDQGRVSEAITAFESLHAMQLAALNADHPDTLATLLNIAGARLAQAEHEAAERIYLDLLPRYERVHGEDAIETMSVMVNLSLVYTLQGRWDEAGQLATNAYAGIVRETSPVHPAALEAASVAAASYARTNRDGEAEIILREVVDNHERMLGPLHSRTLSGRRALIEFYRSRDRTDDLNALVGRYIDMLTAAAIQEDASVQTLNTAAWELLTTEPVSLRNPVAALGFAQRAVTIAGRQDAYVLDTLGLAQLQTNQPEEALATFQEALQQMPPDDPNRAEIQAHINAARAAIAPVDDAGDRSSPDDDA